MAKVKRFLDLFRDLDNQTKGWLFIKAHYIALDKQKHIVLGLSIYLACLPFMMSEYALLITMGFALAKELNDSCGLIKIVSSKKTGFDLLDIFATVLIPTIIQVIINQFI